MKRYFWIVLIIMASLIGVITYNNNFDMIIEQDSVIIEDGKISVEYAKPKQIKKEKPGLILFVHGDGSANKNNDEGYYAAWEALSKENIISISWDKAGVGESSGNWLNQDMNDRKLEAEKILKWALNTFDVDSEKIGVWGASQGGWVITKLLNENDDIKFAIGVAPAVNWMRQGKFNTISEMKNDGFSTKEIEEKLEVESEINKYLVNNDYNGYLESDLESDVLKKDRWDFIRRNMSLDNTNELSQINKPYFLIVGDHDINVDTKETEEIYKKQIDYNFLKIYHVSNATHRMLKPRHQKDNFLTVVESIINPRLLFAPEYLSALKDISNNEFSDSISN